ncbi:HD-GYP domain-containing protein [Paenibacillus sp. PL2-23]|uniref:HD-GYP domain-containing protein n=1 Tax=Paenibacillus sp. PL2-23 TaxID=2100729 RepID=UPI0030F86C6C
MRRDRGIIVKLLLLLLLPLLAYLILPLTPYDMRISDPEGHFYIVSLVSAIGLAVAIMVGIVAAQMRNIKVSFLSLSYVSLAAMFILHGLGTPGLLTDHAAISGNSAQLSVLLSAFWLWLCSISGDRRLVRWLAARQRLLLPVWTASLIGFGLYVWLYPDMITLLHLRGDIGKWITTGLILGMTAWSVYRNLQTFLVSRFPLQLAIVYSSGWMLVAQVILVTGQIWMLSWWLYHFLLLASVIVIAAGIVREYLSSGTLLGSVKRLFRANAQDWIHTCMSPSVQQLVLATEAKDAYTAGHNYRVALYAVKLGEEMGLPSSQLRAIAQGALVHDIGKLYIPDGILNKPGRLTESERAMMEAHPMTGFDLCKRLGFMTEELAVVRSHHERWNGSGYPDRLHGESIPLVARIAAIADVYDALTSSRSYRAALSHEEAMRILLQESGTHFDPRCISAWERLTNDQQSFFQEAWRLSPHTDHPDKEQKLAR